MKRYVLLAIVLLIPTMAYFQKQHFESSLKPKLQEKVLTILEAEGVESPMVRMDYLDAFITGRVKDDAQRQVVATKVAAVHGVRLLEGANKLLSPGWVRISREGGAYRCEGALPLEFNIELPQPLEQPREEWDAGVERRDTLLVPEAVHGWSNFLSHFFAEAGDRSVELRGATLIMRGDATTGLRSDWRARASDVVDRDAVFDEFELFPSGHHFPGISPESIREPAQVVELQEQFSRNVVSFAGSSTQITEDAKAKVLVIARAISSASGEGRYLVGGHPGNTGNVSADEKLARSRAAAVVRLLIEYGVAGSQLEFRSLGGSVGAEQENQVEVVLK